MVVDGRLLFIRRLPRESSRELAALPPGLCIRLQPLEPGKIIVPSYIAHPSNREFMDGP